MTLLKKAAPYAGWRQLRAFLEGITMKISVIQKEPSHVNDTHQ